MWRFRAGCCSDQTDRDHTLTLRTYRRGAQTAGGYPYAVAAGTGPAFVIPAGNQLTSEVTALPARLPIHAGEMVGIEADYPTMFAVYNPTAGVVSEVLFHGYEYLGEQYGNPLYDTAIAINVDVEPDADGDGYGDETQTALPVTPRRRLALPDRSLPPSRRPSHRVSRPSSIRAAAARATVAAGRLPAAGLRRLVPAAERRRQEDLHPAQLPGGGDPAMRWLLDRQHRQPEVGRRPVQGAREGSLHGRARRVAERDPEALEGRRKQLKKKGKLKVEITIDPDEGESTTIAKTLKLPRN